MFLLIDFDDYAEGIESSIKLVIKVAIILGMLGFMSLFADKACNVAIATLILALTIGALYLNVVTIYNALKKKNKNRKIVLLAILILSIIGLIFPINFINIHINRIPSMIILPALFNVIFFFMLRSYSQYRNNKSMYIMEDIKEYFLKLLLGKIVIFSGIVFLIISIIWTLGIVDDDTNKSFLNNIATSYSNFAISQVEYRNDKYSDNRKSDVSMQTIIESEMSKINESYNQTNREKEKYRFIIDYINSDEMKRNFTDIYGLKLSYYECFENNDKYVNKIFIFRVYDMMYEKNFFYEIDIENSKILNVYDYEKEASKAKMNYNK